MDNEKRESPSLIKLFSSPSLQLEKIRENPKVWVPLIIISLLTLVGSLILSSSIDFSQQIGGLSPEEKKLLKSVSTVTMYVGSLVTPAISALIISVILLISVKIVRSDVKFRQLYSMNVYIAFVGVVGLILNNILGTIFNSREQTVYTSLGIFTNKAGVLDGFLSSFELFSLWTWYLTVIGLQKVAGVSKRAAWTIVIVLFALTVLLGIVNGLLQMIANSL